MAPLGPMYSQIDGTGKNSMINLCKHHWHFHTFEYYVNRMSYIHKFESGTNTNIDF